MDSVNRSNLCEWNGIEWFNFIVFVYECKEKRKKKIMSTLNAINLWMNRLMSHSKIRSPTGMGFGAWHCSSDGLLLVFFLQRDPTLDEDFGNSAQGRVVLSNSWPVWLPLVLLLRFQSKGGMGSRQLKFSRSLCMPKGHWVSLWAIVPSRLLVGYWSS